MRQAGLPKFENQFSRWDVGNADEAPKKPPGIPFSRALSLDSTNNPTTPDPSLVVYGCWLKPVAKPEPATNPLAMVGLATSHCG